MRPKVYLIPASSPRCFRRKNREGKWRERVCHAKNQRTAERQARAIEEELAASWGVSVDISWEEFADRYLEQSLSQRRVRTGEKWHCVIKKWKAFLASKGIDPAQLAMREITLPMLLEFEA